MYNFRSEDRDKIILFGDERYIKEVIYVCENILSSGGGYTYILKDEGIKITSKDKGMVILCAYDVEKQETILKDAGLEYGREYLLATDLFKQLDMEKGLPDMPEQRKIAFWGCGEAAQRTIGRSGLVDFYIDRNPSLAGKMLFGKPIVSPDQIGDFSKYYIFITLGDKYSEEVTGFLESKGLLKGKDFFEGITNMNLSGDLPSKMLYKTIHDYPIKEFDCQAGMEKIDFTSDGNMYPCCPNLIDISIGNISGDTTILEAWNSYVAKIVKLSFVNHTYSFCNKLGCTELFSRKSDFEYHDLEYSGANYSNKGTLYPLLPNFNIDSTCNLKCKSCRNEYIVETETERKKSDFLARKIQQELMPYVDRMFLAGFGEVFYSPSYRKIWINKSGKKRKEILILSNGMLFNSTNWKMLRDGYEIIRLNFSLDAASKEIYEKVRLGGIWEVVLRNMKFASELRKNGQVAEFNLRFCYQQANYTDMKPFILLAKELCCDHVFFDRIRNWGTYGSKEFAKNISLFKGEDGLGDLKEEYHEYFSDSIFNESIITGFVPLHSNKH